MSILFIPITLVAVYLLKNDPALLERRLEMREQKTEQKQGYQEYTRRVKFRLIPGIW